MQLPRELQHFPHLTLIVASDTTASKLFLAGNDSLEELDGLSLPKEALPDHEGSFVPGHADLESKRLEKYAVLLAEHVISMVKAHQIVHVDLVMPAAVEHLFSAALPKDISDKVMRRVHLDLMNDAPLEVVKHLVG